MALLFSRKTKDWEEKWNIRTMFGPNLSFAATEAYKLLRTNLMFFFSDEGHGHVIGFTSSVQGEGKSSTACNVAYVLAEAGEKVLLLEADLRRPTIASKLGLARRPGLINMLVNRENGEEIVQRCDMVPDMDVITSGDIPPNPSEMMNSERMGVVLEQLKKEYSYIIVDLPPVTVVSDAVAISKYLDGVVMVVRDDVSDRKLLAEAMRQLKMVDVRILGFVYRDTDKSDKKYSYKYKYKYKKKYYSEYSKDPTKK